MKKATEILKITAIKTKKLPISLIIFTLGLYSEVIKLQISSIHVFIPSAKKTKRMAKITIKNSIGEKSKIVKSKIIIKEIKRLILTCL